MKTLHLSIVAIVGIIIIAMTSVGVFMKKIDDNSGPLYTGVMITGVKENYTLNEPITFSVLVDGYGSGCGDTKAILTKENDSQYKSQVWGVGKQCTSFANPAHFEFNGLSANTTINQAGNYTITASFDDSVTYHHTIAEEKFSVTGHKITSIYDTGVTSHSIQDVFKNNCGQFYTLPQDNHTNGSETYPVLILKQNSTGCAKIAFKIDSKYNEGGFALNPWPQMLNFTDVLHVGKYHYTSSGNSYGVSSIDATTMFKIKSIPEMVDLAKYPVGSRFTVTLVIKPLSNATGFYDYSIDEIPCNSYPLAVGYSPDQVNSSDFSKGMIGMHNHSCIAMPFEISLVQVSGIDFKLVKFS